MDKTKLFPKQIRWENIALDISNAIETINSTPPKKYNTNLFRGLAVGFKSLVYAMEKEVNSQDVYPLFLKWFKLYVRLQNQIDSNDTLRSKFESKIPVCTSYILASLKYQNSIANYHQNIMEMCLLLFKSAQPRTMQNIANLDIELISQLWMPVEFVGDYITQRLCLKLIVAILKHLNAEQRQKKVFETKLDQNIKHLILKLSADSTNFEQVSRELLNVHNTTFSRNCTVFSIYCTKAMFGCSELFKPDNVNHFWIDFNYTSKSVSLLCQLNQSEGKQEEFYIKIKIDKLQIENQFDCSVYTIEQAFFSTKVSAQLLSSRVAVFTLPKNQIDCLKANSDLIDYYNTYSYSESSQVSTPNTIAKYLADLSDDSPLTPYSRNNSDIPKMKVARVKLHKCDAVQTGCRSESDKNQSPNLMIESNPTCNSTSLVSRVEYLPNYVSSLGRESGSNTCRSIISTEDDTVFKKPSTPIVLRAKKQAQSLPLKIKKLRNTSEKTPNLIKSNTWRSKNINKPERGIINFGFSKNKTELITINNTKQQESLSMPPIYKSGRGQVQSQRRNNSKLTRDEISFAYTSIQVSRNSFQRFSNAIERPVEQHYFHNIQQKLIKKNSILEMSFQGMANSSRSATNKPNEESLIRKPIESNKFAESSENLLHLQSTTKENSSPLQASVIPIQRYPTKITNSNQLSQCLEILEENSASQTRYINLSQESSNNQNTLQHPDVENHVTSLKTLNDGLHTYSQNKSPSRISPKPLQIIKNTNSDTTLQSSDFGVQNSTKTSELPKDTSRRFFKYKHLPNIYPTPAAKRKNRKKKSITTETHPKTKSVNLVKPLNYVTDPSLKIIDSISDRKENGCSPETKNLLNRKDKANLSNQKNKAVKDLNLFSDTSDQDFIEKPIKRRASKRKTLLKEVEVSSFVPYSVWKMGQKEKNRVEPIILSPTQKQKAITPETESTRLSKDSFDRIKHLSIKNDSVSVNQKKNSPRSRRSSISSDSVHTYYFSESESETKSGKETCPVRKKPRNSLDLEIVRHQQPEEGIQSPIPVPSEKADIFSPISTSRESILTPIQISLPSDCFDALNTSENPHESHRLLGNRRVSYGSPVRYVSPVYEDLDDEVPEDPLEGDTPQSPTICNTFLEKSAKEARTTKHLSNLDEENQKLPVSPDTLPFLESQEHISRSNNTDSGEVPAIRKQMHFAEALLEELAEGPTTVYSETENNERDPCTNEVIIQNYNVVSSLRTITHPSKNGESLAKNPALILTGYDQLLPEFIKKLTIEKDRLSSSIKIKFNEDIIHNFNKTVDAVTKAIDYHQTAITEEQEKLLPSLENLERHHNILQKNQSELEKLHDQVSKCKQSWDDKADKIFEMYREAEEVLTSYADRVKKDQWHSFSESIICSVNERLRGYLNI